jgi:hypothetical protein
MALVGTTVFGSAISMSGTVVGDYKNSLYIGNRPYHISKGNIMGVVPGAILGAGVAIFLSKLLAEGKIDLLAPQANAFATFTIILAEGQGDWYALGIGFMMGAFVEWATGMGTSFGLGMYLPTVATFPMLIGGAARDWWEKRRLQPKVDAIRLKEGTAAAEKSRALMLLFTFMVAAGALTGEAFFGVESAVLAVADEVEYEETYSPDSWMDDTFLDEVLGVETSDYSAVDNYAISQNSQAASKNNPIPCTESDGIWTCTEPMSMKSSWPMVRMGIFLAVNLALAGAIYVLFKKAGIIGGDDGSSDNTANSAVKEPVMDAEMAD